MDKHSPTRRAILIGNGLNRISQGRRDDVSWKSMIQKLEGEFTEVTQFSEQGEHMPTLFRMQRAANLQDDNNSSLKEWIQTLDSMDTCQLHDILAKQISLFSAIITTNYDHILEKALGIDCQIKDVDCKWGNLYRCQKNNKLAVYHPHGEVGCQESVLYSLKYYMKEISKLIQFGDQKGLDVFNEENPTWLDWFIHSELHICGLEFGYDELTLWHALQKRFDIRGKSNDAFIYLFYDAEKGKMEADARQSLFDSYGVECICIPVYENKYDRAWHELLGTMLIKLDGNHGCAGERVSIPSPTFSTPLHSANKPNEQRTTHDTLATPNKYNMSTDILTFKSAWRGYNVTATAKATDNNPSRCWLNIGTEKLTCVAKRNKRWIFDCLIDGNRYCYCANAPSLQEALHNNNVNKLDNPERYSFYIDYRTGKLFRTIGDADVIMELEKLPLDSFRSALYKITYV